MNACAAKARLPAVAAGLLSMFVVAACQSVDGTWSVSCDAFAGDRLSFADGRYTWDKFTDARRVDEQGRVIDPFPGFPKTGPYALDGGVVTLLNADGGEAARFYLHRREGAVQLLSAAEHERVSGGGAFPDCPLRRGAGE